MMRRPFEWSDLRPSLRALARVARFEVRGARWPARDQAHRILIEWPALTRPPAPAPPSPPLEHRRNIP